jgi:hypothetical protein
MKRFIPPPPPQTIVLIVFITEYKFIVTEYTCKYTYHASDRDVDMPVNILKKQNNLLSRYNSGYNRRKMILCGNISRYIHEN